MAHISFLQRFSIPDLDNPKNQSGNLSVDPLRCKHCGMCVRVCPGSSLELDEEKLPRFKVGEEVACVACGDCVAACPEEAFIVAQPVIIHGRWFNPNRGPIQPPRLFSELAEPAEASKAPKKKK